MTLTQCWHPVPGGTATAAVGMARALADRASVEVIGVGPRAGIPPGLDPGVPIRHLGVPYRALYDLWHLGRQAPERVTGPVDVVHATAPMTPPVMTAPLVMTLHDLFPVLEPEVLTRRGVRLMCRAIDLARDRATIVMCSSRQTLEDADALGFDTTRLRLVPLGVEPSVVTAEDRSRVRTAHRLDRPYVLWVGTLEPRKNLPRLIEAFTAAGLEDVELILAGPPGWKESIDVAVAASGGRVRHLGFVAPGDLPALMAEARVLALPSLREGFGLPALEAMVQGTPVVGSAGTAVAEVVAETGLLVDPGDRDGWVEALRVAACDDRWRSERSDRARDRAGSYSWSRTADALIAGYEDAITAGPRRRVSSRRRPAPEGSGSASVAVSRPIVAVVAVPPPVTGQAVATTILLRAAAAAGADLSVIDISDELVRQGLAANLKRIGAALRNATRVARRSGGSRETRPLVYVQLGQGPASMLRDLPVLGVAWLRRLAVVGHVHGGGWRHGSDQLPRPLRRLHRRLVSRSTRLIVVTERLRHQFDGLVDSERVVVVGNGVEVALAEAAATEPARWSTPPTVAFVSNLLPGKGVETVFEAARLAGERGLAHRFVVAGAAGGAALGAATGLDNLELVGPVDLSAKIAVLRRSQVFVLPTSYWVEGEPIALLEAMHFGVPVVSCDRGGIADIVDDVTGLLVAPDDPAALLDAIVALTADEGRWSARSSAIATQARERHGPDRHGEAMLAVLAEAARTDRGG